MSDSSINIVTNLYGHRDLLVEPKTKECGGEKQFHCLKYSSLPLMHCPQAARESKNTVEGVTHYITRRKIGDLMLFMMQHLLINEPDDPVSFLQQLMDKCLMFRSGILCNPPLLFEDRHIESMYNSLDPLGVGSISIKQYHVGLQTLGLKKKEYEMEPEVQADGSLSKQTFISNAKMGMVEAFMDLIMLPPPREDGESSSIETFYH